MDNRTTSPRIAAGTWTERHYFALNKMYQREKAREEDKRDELLMMDLQRAMRYLAMRRKRYSVSE